MDQNANRRRRDLDTARRGFDAGAPDGDAIARDISASWRRCERTLATTARAPIDLDDPVDAWEASRIRRAAPDVIDQLGAFASNEDYAAVVTDPAGRILWGSAGGSMARRAEAANFVRGSNWSETLAGTNAPGLALQTGRSAAVFASEHWCDSVQDWVCYAAPVRDPTGEIVGVIDLSSHWKRAVPMALMTVSAFARVIEHQLAAAAPAQSSELRLRVLGAPYATLRGQEVHFSNRQVEILVILACHDGVGLGELHYLLYGERTVSVSTLKAEISNLRRILGGGIGSRPYRLTIPVDLDLSHALDATARGDLERAMHFYRGPLMPHSESPFITDIRHNLEATLDADFTRTGRQSATETR